MKALLRMSLTILLVGALFAGLAAVASGPIVASSPFPHPQQPCPSPLPSIGVR
jgi:hypothetical protein